MNETDFKETNFEEVIADNTIQDSKESQDSHNNSNNQENHIISFWSYNAAKILLGLVILSICLSIFSIYTCSKINGLNERINGLNESVDVINQNMLFMNLGIDMTEGVVTEKSVVQKASFYVTGVDEIIGSIDIRPQPSYSYKFLGQGDFDLTDRELRSMLEEIIDEVIEYGDFKQIESEGNLSLGTIYITANNFDVGEYKDGKVVLAGEY